MNLAEKERIEIDFWKITPEEKPDVFSIPSLINKFKEADIFLDKITRFSSEFSAANTIFELGGGQCWSACILKHYHPAKTIFASDISAYAVASAPKWESICQVSLNKVFPAKSYDIPLPDESVDLVYCFASAHHFVRQKSTFKEINRILKKGGLILYLYEPVCRKYIHGLAKKRANKKRPVVPEDVLIYKKMLAMGNKAGFESKIRFSPTLKNRSTFGTLYYWGLNVMPVLQHFLPCTADFIFRKNDTAL